MHDEAPVAVNASHNMNDRLKQPGLVRVDDHMAPQKPLDMSGKAVSGLTGTGTVFPQPSAALATLQPATRRSSFVDADLVEAGAGFDAALANQGVTAGAGPTAGWATFATSPTDFDRPDIADGAYGVWRFNLPGYVEDALHPSTVGLDWDEASEPQRWFLGLSSWAADKWVWFEGTDEVITVDDLNDYINSTTSDMLVAVVAFSEIQANLRFLQAGAFEVRGLGGAAPVDADRALTLPDFGIADRTTSAYSVPSASSLDLNWFGPVTNQRSLGSCGGHAGAGYLTYLLRKTYGYQYNPRRMDRQMSPQWTYKRSGGQLCGSSWWRTADEVFNSLRDVGGVTRSKAFGPWDCYERWNQADCLAQAPYFKIKDYQEINVKDGDLLGFSWSGTNNIKYVISQMQLPVFLCGFFSNNLMPDPLNPEVYDWVSEYHLDLPNVGMGHNVLIVGYDDAKQAFLVRNSWGEEWNADHGIPGYFWMSYASFASKMEMWGFIAWMDYDPATAAYLGITNVVPYGPPAGLTATNGDFPDRVELSWSAVSHPGLLGYEYCRDNDTAIGFLDPAEHTNVPDPVSDFRTHYYKVRAVLSSGRTPWSAPVLGYKGGNNPPVIRSISVLPVIAGEARQFTVDPYTPGNNGLNVTITWNIPDAATTATPPYNGYSVSVIGEAPGNYLGSVTVTNAYGSDTETFNFSVLASGVGPTAQINGPTSGTVNVPLYFSGAASTAFPGTSIVAYEWDTTNDLVADYPPSPTSDTGFIWNTPGIKVIQLRVKDNYQVYSPWVGLGVVVSGPPVRDEIEDNDVPGVGNDEANILSMDAFQQYSGSVGTGHGYPNEYDGDLEDYWKFNITADGSWSVVVNLLNRDYVDYGNVIVYDKDFNVIGSNFTEVGNPADLTAQVDFSGTQAQNPYYVKVFADISTGGFDYTLGWAPGP